MLQSTASWAVSKALAFAFPFDTHARPRSTLDTLGSVETVESRAWRLRDEARRSLKDEDIQLAHFEAHYLPPIHRPRDNLEAQQLYNHIRTVAWYLDSIPLLGSRLPFNIGVESIIGIVPGVGDYVGLVLGLYQILLCSLFGVPLTVILWMILNVVVDCMLGIVPIIGDALDVIFKANLRNLRLLEDHLHQTSGRCGAGLFYIAFPPSDSFLPSRRSTSAPRDPPPYSPARDSRHSIREGDLRIDGRAYLLSLPASIADADNAAAISSTRSRHSAGPPSSNGKATDAQQELSTHAQDSTQQSRDYQPGEAEAYVIPDESTVRALNTSQPGGQADLTDATLKDQEHMNGRPSLCVSQKVQDSHLVSQSVTKGESQNQHKGVAHHQVDASPAAANVSKDLNPHLHSNGVAPARSSRREDERPRISWHDLANTSSSPNGKADAKQRRRDAQYDDDGEIDDSDYEDRGLLKSKPLDRERDLEDPRALWRRRRSLYLLVYSAIFCVAFVTSLDSNTGYLYLNFACSEYGALASFSTVAIVQQMVFAIAKPPIAKLSDVIGRPQAYVLSLVFYVLGYTIVASTGSLRSLIGGICLQSAGTTGIQVLQSIIIADTTTAKWRGLVIGIVNLPFLINFAVAGPMVDLVMRHGGWRYGFAIWTVMVPLAATPLLLTLLVGQRRARRAGLATRSSLTDKPWRKALRQLATELDLLGLLLFTGGWLLILLPLTLAGHGERQAQVPTATFILGGVGLLVLFGWWETRASVPILPYQFLTNSAVVCTCVVGVLDFASFYISWTFLSSFIQILKGWDQTKTGYFATTQNVTSTITGIVVGSLMAMTRRYKTLLMTGLVVRLLGVTLMVRYRTADDPTFMLVLCQLLQGIGGGSIAITMQVAVQVTVRHADVAIVTALELLTTEIGAAIGSATAGWMFQTYLPAKLRANLPNMDADELKLVYGSLQKALSYPIGTQERTAIIESWVQVMRLLSIVATLTLVPAVLLGLAIPDASLPDVHGSSSNHHHHPQRHHHRHHGSRQGDRRSGRRRPSFLSSSRPSSPLEIRAGHSDTTLGMGLGVVNEDNPSAGFLATTGSKRSRSASRNRAGEGTARNESNARSKKHRAGHTSMR